MKQHTCTAAGRAASAARRSGALFLAAVVGLTVLAMAGAVNAQDADAAQPAEPADVTTLEAEVISIEGTVQKRLPADDAAWEAVAVGDKLGQKTLIRTGMGSECVLKFADRGEVTVKSLTKSGIGRFLKSGEKVQAEVGLKYGAVHTAVDSSKGSNDFRVATPMATVAIRGSDVHVGNSEMGPGFQQGTGHGQIAYNNGRSRWLNPGTGQTDGNQMPSQFAANEVAAYLGDVTGGLTQAELDIINNYLSGGPIDSTFQGFGGSGFGNNSTPSSVLQQYTDPCQGQDLGPFYGLPVWSGEGRWEEVGHTGYSTYGYWDGGGSWYHEGIAGTWMGSGTWESADQPQEGVFSNAVLTGSGTWQAGRESGTWSGTGVGSGAVIPDEPESLNGTWKGAGVAVDWQTGGEGGEGQLQGGQMTTGG